MRLWVNLGGEGEVPGVLNQQGPWVLHPGWRSSRAAETLAQLIAAGHQFIIADNTHLPFPVPIDITTHLGPGVQSTEILRILKSGGRWIRNGQVFYVKP